MLGEVIFGGVGAGLYGILVFVILSVFIAGLMVGRTPEYLGKKIEAFDVKMAMLAVLIFPLMILVLTAVSVVVPEFAASAPNGGPHGLSEILYAFTSGTGNNGSAFAGLSANTCWYNTSIGVSMLVGRFMIIIPVLAIAGSLGAQEDRAAVSGHVPRDDAALLDAARRRHPDRRGAHVLPGAQPRPRRRAPVDGGRADFLK